MAGPLIWNGLNAKALTNDILIDNANYNALRVGNQFAHNSSTGVESGGILSINADPTKFDLTAGTGTVVTYTTPTAPTIKSIVWPAFTAQTVTGLGVQDETYILISPLGAIIQQSNYPSTSQRRTNIFIGRIGHSSRTVVNFATSFPDFSQSVSSQLFDLFDALGPFNITGNQIANNGATMNFQKSTGSMCFRSFNYPTDNYTPHISTVAAAVPVSFFYRTQTLLVAGGPVTIIQPNQYDNGGVVTAVDNGGVVTAVGGGVNRSTIQRVYLAPNGVVNIQLGQTIYPTLADAIAAIGTDPFVQNPAITNVTVLIGYIVLKNSTVALNNTADAMFFKAPKFEVGVGGGVNTVTSLQQTYNSSTQPQIILDSTHGGLQVFDNAAPIAGNLYQVANNTGATNYFSVSAASVATTLPVTAGQVIDTGLTANTAVFANASKQLTSSATNDTQLGYLNTTTSNVQTQIDRKAGGRNYIQDPLLTQGTTAFWSLGTTGTLTNGIPTGAPTFGSGASGNLSISASSSGPLEGAFSLQYQHVTNQTVAGNMMATNAIPLEIEDQARVLGVKFAYKVSVNPTNGNFSGTLSNSFGWAVYDVTNSAWIATAGQFNLVQSSGTGICTGTLQIPSNTTSIRFVFYNVNATSATTGGGAITMLLDDFYLGPQVTSIAPAMSDWTAYPLTIGATTTAPTPGTNTKTAYWRRAGDSMEISFQFAQTSVGSAGSGTYLFPLPAGVTIDAAKINNSVDFGFQGTCVGAAKISDGTTTLNGTVNVRQGNNTALQLFSNQALGGLVSSTYGALSNANVNYSYVALVPIAGWSSNTVSSADTDTRVVAACVGGDAPSATAGNPIIFPTTFYDTTGSYNPTTGKYLVSVSGIYRIHGFLESATTGAIIFAYVDNVNTRTLGLTPTGGDTAFTGSVKVNAGQLIHLTTDTTVDASTISSMCIERLSGPAVVQASESVTARYISNAATNFGSAVTSIIPYDTKEKDSHGSVTTGASWKFVAPISGTYAVKAALAVQSIAGVYVNALYVYKNGAVYAQLAYQKFTYVADDAQVSGSTDVIMNAGDFIDIRFFQNSGGIRAQDGAAGNNWVSISKAGN